MATWSPFAFAFGSNPARVRLHSAEHQRLLPSDREEEITLRAIGEGGEIKEATDLALHGRAYQTENDAAEAAARWRGLLQKAFARVNLGADFGDRAPTGALTDHGRKWMQEQFGVARVLDNVHGTLVYECEPTPRFVGMSATPIVGRNVGHFIAAMSEAVERDVVMSGRDQVAYDLYGASFGEVPTDARFLMLMMAVETMIEPKPRASNVQAHVEGR